MLFHKRQSVTQHFHVHRCVRAKEKVFVHNSVRIQDNVLFRVLFVLEILDYPMTVEVIQTKEF